MEMEGKGKYLYDGSLMYASYRRFTKITKTQDLGSATRNVTKQNRPKYTQFLTSC